MVVRVTCIAEEGRDHLALLRKLSRGTKSLLVENHIVPLWGEVHFEDISFTIRPLVGHSMDDCYGYWAKNSVGDVVDMIIQALEVRVKCSAEVGDVLTTWTRPSASFMISALFTGCVSFSHTPSLRLICVWQ